MGGSIRGGRLAGERLYPARETLHQDRDYPVLNEYRALLGGLPAGEWAFGPSGELIFPAGHD